MNNFFPSVPIPSPLNMNLIFEDGSIRVGSVEELIKTYQRLFKVETIPTLFYCGETGRVIKLNQLPETGTIYAKEAAVLIRIFRGGILNEILPLPTCFRWPGDLAELLQGFYGCEYVRGKGVVDLSEYSKHVRTSEQVSLIL